MAITQTHSLELGSERLADDPLILIIPGLGNSDEPRRDRGGLPPRHPSGGARRQSPRLDPLPTGGM